MLEFPCTICDPQAHLIIYCKPEVYGKALCSVLNCETINTDPKSVEKDIPLSSSLFSHFLVFFWGGGSFVFLSNWVG